MLDWCYGIAVAEFSNLNMAAKQANAHIQIWAFFHSEIFTWHSTKQKQAIKSCVLVVLLGTFESMGMYKMYLWPDVPFKNY